MKKDLVGNADNTAQKQIKTTSDNTHCFDLNFLIDTDLVHREDLFKPEDVESRACEYQDQHLGFTCNTHESKLKHAAIAAAKRCKGSSLDGLISAISKAVHSPILITNDYVRVFNPSKYRWDNLEIFGERGFFEVERSV